VSVENGKGEANFDLSVAGRERRDEVHTVLSSAGNNVWTLDEATYEAPTANRFHSCR